MPKAFYLSFANLTCRFGESFVLLDLAKEVIYPAFFDETYRRVYGPTAYFFRDVGMAAIDVDGVEHATHHLWKVDKRHNSDKNASLRARCWFGVRHCVDALRAVRILRARSLLKNARQEGRP
jgi:hypothetical protein